MFKFIKRKRMFVGSRGVQNWALLINNFIWLMLLFFFVLIFILLISCMSISLSIHFCTYILYCITMYINYSFWNVFLLCTLFYLRCCILMFNFLTTSHSSERYIYYIRYGDKHHRCICLCVLHIFSPYYGFIVMKLF